MWYVLVIALTFGLGGCAPTEMFSTPTPLPTPVRPRRITENTLELREYWRVSFDYVGDDLVATPGRVVYVDSVNNVPHVRVLDAATGDLLWEVVEGYGASWIAADIEWVYLKNRSVLHAYAMEDGRLLWQRQFTPRRGHSFDPSHSYRAAAFHAAGR